MAAVVFQPEKSKFLHLAESSNQQISALIALNCLLKKGAGFITHNEINEFLVRHDNNKHNNRP